MEEVGGKGGEEGGVEDEEGGDAGGGGSEGGREGFIVVQAEVTRSKPDDGPFCLGLRCGGGGGSGEASECSEGRTAAAAGGAEGGLECLRAERKEGTTGQQEGWEEPDDHLLGVAAGCLSCVG